MSGDPQDERGGLFAALKNIGATVIGGVRTRLLLLANEVEEEKRRAVQLFVMAQGMLFCCGVGALLAVALLTALFWDYRLLILSLSTAFFFVLAGVFYALFKHFAERPEHLFSTSIAELEEDLRQLKAAVGRE